MRRFDLETEGSQTVVGTVSVEALERRGFGGSGRWSCDPRDQTRFPDDMSDIAVAFLRLIRLIYYYCHGIVQRICSCLLWYIYSPNDGVPSGHLSDFLRGGIPSQDLYREL